MRKIEFHDREREIKEIHDILDTEPTLITFIYGPINSGKTELINHLLNHLSGEYVAFYINLRTKFLSSYEDFVEALFEIEIEETERRETLKELVSSITTASGIPMNRKFIDYIFKDKKPTNAFSYIIKLFEEVKRAGKQPVLILDELQKIEDVKINGSLIYELFNFFIDLTKEKHLAHVFAVSSDSLFIERIYSEAMLQGRCRYLLVDDFDKSTTFDFLNKYTFMDSEKDNAWKYCGGKPICLVEIINSRNRKNTIEEMYNVTCGRIETELRIVKELGDEIIVGNKSHSVQYDNLINILKNFIVTEKINLNEIDEVSKRFLVKKNILFLDPLSRTIRPQSLLNLLAIRSMMNK
jgi:AAA+ ATPase superfamily predicted ATPase